MVQLVGRSAAIEVNSVILAYIKNVRMSVKNTKIKEHDDAGAVDVLERGDVSYTVSAEYGYAASVELALAVAGTPVDVVLYPEGKTASKPMLTMAGCILDFEVSFGRVGVLLSRVEGEGKSLTPGVYTV